MDNQVQSIVCPNCGANPTNHQNCEYCGSFLIKFAAEGRDISNYLKDAARFSSSGLEKVLHEYTDLFTKYPDAGLCWELDWNGNPIIGLTPASLYSSEFGPGYAIDFKSDALKQVNALGRFLNSSAYEVFDSFSGLVNDNGEPVDLYLANFGYDYKGAMRLILQLLEDVFKVPLEETDSSIFLQPGDGNVVVDYISYNCKGDRIKRGGLGFNDFEEITTKNVSDNKAQIVQEQQDNEEAGKKKKWSIIATVILILIIILSYLL